MEAIYLPCLQWKWRWWLACHCLRWSSHALPHRSRWKFLEFQRKLSKFLLVIVIPLLSQWMGNSTCGGITQVDSLVLEECFVGAEKIVSTPRRLDCLDGFHIKMVSLGSEHSFAITDEGDALSWGAGGSGRLGHGHQSGILGFLRSSSEYTPRLIKNLEGVKVTKIAVGLLHSACISEQGSVFTFGERTMGRLGFGEANNATSPSIISEIPLSQGVSCGGYHTCVITGEGELYTWGSNENGCLGLGGTDAVHTPLKVEGSLLKFPVSEVSCGWKHTAAISGGNLFTWGWGGSHGTFSIDGHSSGGQLGHGNDIDYFEPMMVNLGKEWKALQVSCGFNHTGAIFEYSEA
ncbi:ultraviolet-B receptor UVR8 isoform X5 [Magnolia sinica]|uniref:ultraviolet-B receptor UVR8 isoform X5 n=1 Tax=Magnolia sinica TaxID=86752 RepID=UPI00265ACD8B|nr:ultraviolet-B receptor UVR8 isoform X5 [Magnolia sinica]